MKGISLLVAVPAMLLGIVMAFIYVPYLAAFLFVVAAIVAFFGIREMNKAKRLDLAADKGKKSLKVLDGIVSSLFMMIAMYHVPSIGFGAAHNNLLIAFLALGVVAEAVLVVMNCNEIDHKHEANQERWRSMGTR